jgi:hypothetical protein
VTDLVPYTNGRSWVALMAPAVELAKHVSETAFVPKGLRGNPPAIVAAIMYGDEVGLGPMQALAKIAVIDGRPSLSAEAQRALILAAGHDIWVEEATNTRVTVGGMRSNSDRPSKVTWTLDDAKRAGLAGRPNWRSYPRQMLMARATAELARLIFADAVGGIAATEELEDGEEFAESGAEEPKGNRRKRRSVAAPETTSRSETATPERELPPLPGEDKESGASPLSPAVEELPIASAAQPGDAPASLNLTTRQLKKLNMLVGQLRESGHITTEQLYSALARSRNVSVDVLVELYPDAYDEFGVLHWSPLRDSLIREEASDLIDRLERLEQNTQASPRDEVKPAEEKDG